MITGVLVLLTDVTVVRQWLKGDDIWRFVNLLSTGTAVKQVPAFPLHQCDEACLSLLAHHSIRFPVATDGTVRCTGRTLFDGVRYDELATMFFAAFLVTPFPVMP